MSGYDIKKHIDNSISYFWSENYGHLYPVLAKLEKDGLIQLAADKKNKGRAEGGRGRKVYTATPEGHKRLCQWLHEPAAAEYFRNELLLKFFFGLFVEPAVTIKSLEREKAQCRKILGDFAEIEKKIQEHAENDHTLYGLLSLKYGIKHYTAMEQWCAEALKTLGAEKLRRRKKALPKISEALAKRKNPGRKP
jgi:DNA-binding PadR family transcriptional regulator